MTLFGCAHGRDWFAPRADVDGRRGAGPTSATRATAHARRRTRDAMAAAGYELRGIYGTEPYWPEKKLTICVTGAGGFIGSHLAKRLKEEGHRVVACDWKRNEHMEVRSRDRAVMTRKRCVENVFIV